MDVSNTPVWRIHKDSDGKVEPVLVAWYTGHEEDRFLTPKTFGTRKEADAWLKEFWQAYWQLAL